MRRRLVAENANSNWIDLFYAVNYGGLNNKVLLGIQWRPYAQRDYYWSMTRYQGYTSHKYIRLSLYTDPANYPDATSTIELASGTSGSLGFGLLPVYGRKGDKTYLGNFSDLDESVQWSYFSSHFDGTWVTYMIQDATECYKQYVGYITSVIAGTQIAGVSTYGIGVSDEHYAEVLVEDA